jgi:outer membrane receptor protein involved in Fe transport
VERYFNETTSVYMTGFFKRVEGFVATVSNSETYSGVTYQVSRPQNANAANVKGVELGYQQFYEFLPGWMKGFGLQANYTHVESDTPSSIAGLNIPLQNLSKRSYNKGGGFVGATSNKVRQSTTRQVGCGVVTVAKAEGMQYDV